MNHPVFPSIYAYFIQMPFFSFFPTIRLNNFKAGYGAGVGCGSKAEFIPAYSVKA